MACFAHAVEWGGFGAISIAGVSSGGFSSIRPVCFTVIGKCAIVTSFMEQYS